MERINEIVELKGYLHRVDSQAIEKSMNRNFLQFSGGRPTHTINRS